MRTLNVTLVQASTHWHDAVANRGMFEDQFERVPSSSAVVVLPEMFSTGFSMASAEVAEPMAGATVQWLQASARALDKVVCGSVVIAAENRFFNRFLWVTPAGDVQIYDKRHLFRMAGEHQFYAPGSRRVVIAIDGWRICLMVCYDLRFPVWFRNRQDYDALLCVANWPAARQSAWSTLLRARAIENQAYALGCNIVGTDGNGVRYRGGSAAFAPDGATLAEAGDEACLLNVALDPDVLANQRETFPVWRDADTFEVPGINL